MLNHVLHRRFLYFYFLSITKLQRPISSITNIQLEKYNARFTSKTSFIYYFVLQ